MRLVIRLCLYPLDLLLALAALVVMFLCGPLLARVWRLGRRQHLAGILFHSHEGRSVAPTRVRAYHFAERLNEVGRAGVCADVYCHWDQVFRLPGLPRRHYFKVELVWAIWRSYLHMLGRNYAVVIDQRPNYHSWATLLYKLSSGCVVLFDIDDWIFDCRLYLPPLKTRTFLAFYRWICNGGFVASEPLREEMSKLITPVIMIPTYPDEKLFYPRPLPGPPVRFSWIGTVFDRASLENVEFLLNAFRLAYPAIRGAAVLDCRVGFNPVNAAPFRELETLVDGDFRDLPVSLGEWLAPENIPAYLAGIHVGLYALVAPTLFQRSKSPTKAFEYMASGRPIIATVLGEVRRFVISDETGFLVEDQEDCARRMVQLARDPELVRRMGQAARRRVEEEYNLTQAVQLLRVGIDQALCRRGH